MDMKMSDLVLITFFITSQSTGHFKAMFRFASHCFEMPVIWMLFAFSSFMLIGKGVSSKHQNM
jgi:hypothetical protein